MGMKAATADRRTEMADLVHTHQADVWRYLRFLGCDPSEADDLVQETFLMVLRRPFEIRSTAQSAGYLRKVARNQLLMARRRQTTGPQLVDLDAAEAVWSQAAGQNGLDDYLAALGDCLNGTLAPRSRRAVEMQYHDRAGRAQIAEELGLAIEGVKTLLRRARDVLRDCVERRLAQ